MSPYGLKLYLFKEGPGLECSCQRPHLNATRTGGCLSLFVYMKRREDMVIDSSTGDGDDSVA